MSEMGHPRPGRGAASPAASATPPESGSNFRASAAPRPAVAVDGTAADVIQARKLEPASCAFRRNEIAKTPSALARIFIARAIWSNGSSIDQQCRRFATRYGKLATNYLAFIKLASIRVFGCALMSSRP